jgi:tetrahydromethanopterin S-methyltransferase subunit D
MVGMLRGKTFTVAHEELSLELVTNSILAILSSTEAFAAHISMYAVIHQQLTYLYGWDFVALAASIVPRIVWPDRPADSYLYYVTGIGAAQGQGWTIAHPTSWFLNFGVIGVILGALVFGYVWVKLYNAQERSMTPISSWRRVGFFLAPLCLTAFMPSFVRAGISGYKAVVLEGLMIPIALVWSGVWYARRFHTPGTNG